MKKKMEPRSRHCICNVYNICINISQPIHIYVWVCLCVCVYVCVSCVCVCIHTYVYIQMIFDKGANRESFSTNGAETTVYLHGKK